MKKIAIVGAGISGLTCAALLGKDYEITLFEANDYLGGHASTYDVTLGDKTYPIDTGFVVFNEKTYPEFCKLLKRFNITYEPTEMSFSYRSDKTHFEYNGHNINTLFADRINFLNPRFYEFLWDIYRFNAAAKRTAHALNNTLTLYDFVKKGHYHKLFMHTYLMPIIASIWSKKMKDVWNFPAKFLFSFMENHGLLNMLYRPTWFTITGGSRNYVKAFTKATPFIYTHQAVQTVMRENNHVVLQTQEGVFRFDAVILALHSDQALQILKDASTQEQAILGAIPYTSNESILHTDASLLPLNKRAWASWNYYEIGSNVSTLTYYMNRLQNLTAKEAICLSTNLSDKIAPQKVICKFQYAHPSFSAEGVYAQQQKHLINGQKNTYFCGAYWGYGFHEDGVVSALAVCELLGVRI